MQITHDLTFPVENQDVIIVEDIVDTGLSMKYLLENLATRRPRSVKICSLLHKPARTRVQIDIDYLGFTIEDKFVVGYGLKQRSFATCRTSASSSDTRTHGNEQQEARSPREDGGRGRRTRFRTTGSRSNTAALAAQKTPSPCLARMRAEFSAYVPQYLMAANVDRPRA